MPPRNRPSSISMNARCRLRELSVSRTTWFIITARCRLDLARTKAPALVSTLAVAQRSDGNPAVPRVLAQGQQAGGPQEWIFHLREPPGIVVGHASLVRVPLRQLAVTGAATLRCTASGSQPSAVP